MITCAPANNRNCNLSHCPVSHNGCSSLTNNYRRINSKFLTQTDKNKNCRFSLYSPMHAACFQYLGVWQLLKANIHVYINTLWEILPQVKCTPETKHVLLRLLIFRLTFITSDAKKKKKVIPVSCQPTAVSVCCTVVEASYL